MFKGIDLSSDTATKPSLPMKHAMLEAELGDEQKGEDPTTHQLEAMIAELLGFDQGLFFPSATMANEVAIKLLCEPGDQLLAAENCHLFICEGGGPAVHAGVMARGIPTTTGIFTGDDLRAAYLWNKGLHYPVSKCVSIENTSNFGGGLAWDLASLDSVLTTAKDFGLKTHLDGARLFNAAIKLGIQPKRLSAGFDTASICLSKGLGCPIGAVLALSHAHYARARYLKHLFGGAMRQSGILAAAGVYALNNHVQRLADDHHHAELFAHFLKSVPSIELETHPLSTNMVFFKWVGSHLSTHEFSEKCIAAGLRFSQVGKNRFRAVFHLGINRQDVDSILSICAELFKNM